jgi:hypothetical protein
MPLVLDCLISRKAWLEKAVQRNGASVRTNADHRVEKTDESAGLWEPTVQKLGTFHHLGEKWDGLEAVAPAADLLASATGLACLLKDRGVEAPQRVVPGLEGTVIFEWQFADGTHAEIEIVRPLYAEVMIIEPGKPAKHWTIPTE